MAADEVDLRALGALVPECDGMDEKLPVGSRPADLDAALAEVERLRAGLVVLNAHPMRADGDGEEYWAERWHECNLAYEDSVRRCAEVERLKRRLQAFEDTVALQGSQIPALYFENERLRAENAALRATLGGINQSEPEQRPDADAPAAACVRPVPAQPAPIPANALLHAPKATAR